MVSKPSPVCPLSRATQFKTALRYMHDEGSSLSRAGEAFSVSKTSLHRRATGVVEVVLLRSKHGVCMTDNEIRILARRVAIEKHGTIPDSFPSKKWSLRFVKRHGAVISRKRSQILNAKRNDISTEKHLRDCHANLQDAMQGQLPGQVWNCD
ncbi:hypothetical protein L916_04308 [Phytophthora nicotianae]|uniref:HTH CENPB-type domain-containing protein n=1 Tax=Phytophthora nicotianae TaxID=4792 RepID=W2JGU5_PHYNI|nr:hypothetical protein L916_04308 [Phytophthora nicotianae]